MKINVKMRHLLIAFSLGLLCGCGRGDGMTRPRAERLQATADEIVPWIQDQAAFLVSPDGGQLLVKRDLHGGDTELVLTELETGQEIGRYRGGFPLLISWRPGNACLSFVRDKNGDRNFRLMFWTPGNGKLVTPNAPILHSANRLMRWSPDGRWLAFCAAERAMQSGPLLVLDADRPDNEPRLMLNRTDILDLAWSPDSKKLAVAAESEPGNVTIVDADTKAFDSLHVGADRAVKYVAWTQDGAGLVVSCNKPGGKSYELRRVDMAVKDQGTKGPRDQGTTSGNSGQAKGPRNSFDKVRAGERTEGVPRSERVSAFEESIHVVFRHEGRIRDITPLEDGRIVFRAVSDGMGKLMIATPDGRSESLPFGDGTTSLLAVNQAHRVLYAIHTGIVTPPGLYEMSLETRSSRLVFQPFQTVGRQGVAPETAFVSVPNGPTLPVLVWKSETRPSRGVIIIFPNQRGGERPPVFFGSVQYFLERGYDYVAFAFQPNGGNALNERDIETSLAVVDYARKELGASLEKVALFGRSGATVYVIETARHMRERAGILVLLGMTRSSTGGEGEFDHRFRIAVLQGENDPVPPAMAKSYVEGVFGPRALSGAEGFFYTLKNEGHTPRLLRSRALVYAAIVELLEQ